MSFEIAKAGWLYRLSSVLRRWKKNWFVLYRNGEIRYFESPDSHLAEEFQLMPAHCQYITTGVAVQGAPPPEGSGSSSMLEIKFKGAKWTLCAESPDDMQAWHMALEDARIISPAAAQPQFQPPVMHQNQIIIPNNNTGAYPRQMMVYGYPGQSNYGNMPSQYVVQNPNGSQTTVIYTQDPNYRHHYCNNGLGTGLLAGAAMGSMMMWPLMWW